jgi:hypothetical protein
MRDHSDARRLRCVWRRAYVLHEMGGSFSTTNPVYRDCSRPCCRANSSSPFALLVSCPRPPCLSVSLRKSASKNSNGQYRMRLKMGTMRRSVSHGHRRPLTRPGLAPCCALPRWRVGVALFIWPRPLMGFGLAVLLLCIGCPRLVHRLACPPLVLPRACPPQVHHTHCPVSHVAEAMRNMSCVACCRGHAEWSLASCTTQDCVLADAAHWHPRRHVRRRMQTWADAAHLHPHQMQQHMSNT